MDDTATSAGAGSPKKCDVMDTHMLQGACEVFLFQNSTFAVLRLDPFCCWAPVGGEQSGIDAVAMKFPAGIIVDAL